MCNNIGKLIEERVKAVNMDVTEFARRINRERSNVYHIFKRDNINTDLLKIIGQVLDYDFFIHFLNPETVEKIKISENIKNSKFYIEIDLSEEQIKNTGVESKIVNILYKAENEDLHIAAEPEIEFNGKKKNNYGRKNY